MRNILSFVSLLIVLFFVSCNSPELSSQQYYEKGLQFIESGNINGAIVGFKKAIEKDQNYFEARYQLSLAYILQGKSESAEKELLKVLQLNPSFYQAHLSLAKTFLQRGEFDKTIEKINLYLLNKDDNPESYELAAAAYVQKKDYTKAEDVISKALKVSAGRLSSKILLADVYVRKGAISKAEKIISQVLEVDNANITALHVLAEIKNQQNNISETIKAYQTILSIDGEDIYAHLRLGFNYLRNKDYDRAKETGRKLVESNKNRPEGPYLMGVVYFHEKKIDEAIVSLQESLKFASIPGAYYYLGLSYMAKEDLEQATSAFQRVIDLQPEAVQPRLLLSVAHLKKGRDQEAEREIQEVLSADGENAFAHNLLGSVHLAFGRNDLAMEEFDRAIELNPELIDARLKKGAFNLIAGNKRIAEKEFINAVEIAPDAINARVILARYYIKNKKYEEAIKTLNTGLKENNEDALLYNIMAEAYLGAEDMDNAVELYEKAITSNSDFILPYINLGLLYLKSNEKDKAISVYNRILYLDKDNVTAMLMLAGIMEADKENEKALSYYMKAKEQKKTIAYLSLAGYYQRKKDSNKAIGVLDEALSINPKNINVLDLKGRIFLAGKEYQKALSLYRNLSTFSRETGKERLAGVYALMGEYDNAIRELRDILFDVDNRMSIMAKVASLYIKKKDFKAAEQVSNEIISEFPESAAGYQILAKIYSMTHKSQDAINILKKVDKLSPNNIKTKVMLGREYIAYNDLDKAMAIFKAIEKSNPNYAEAQFLQAGILERMGKNKLAAEKYKDLLNKFPDYVPALNNLSYLFSEGYGPSEEAVHLAQKANKLAPEDGRINDTLGWAYYKTEKHDDALKYFLKAAYYLPEQPTVQYHIALAYYKKGMQAKTEEHLNNAIRNRSLSTFPELDEAKKFLEAIKKK